MSQAAFNIDDLDDDEYTRLVLREMHDRATDAEAESLREDSGTAREWRDTLVRLVQRVDAKLAKVRGEAMAKEQDCRRKGLKGKDEWFRYQAESEMERKRLVGFKTRIVDRLREAKLLLHELAQDEDDDKGEVKEARLGRIEAKLDRLLAHLKVPAPAGAE